MYSSVAIERKAQLLSVIIFLFLKENVMKPYFMRLTAYSVDLMLHTAHFNVA